MAMLSSSLFNIIFDYLFVFPMNMGMAGAALATVLSPVLEFTDSQLASEKAQPQASLIPGTADLGCSDTVSARYGLFLDGDEHRFAS